MTGSYYINAKQASARLHMSRNTIQRLVKDGRLKDYGVTPEGKKKHVLQLDPKEVEQLRKELKVRATYDSAVDGNGHGPAIGAGITTRLARIEQGIDALTAKVERLAKLWE